ncbi:MAG: methylated-DNA--[protein]-cysteine S-methyltransferase [Halalkalicoccus sp.]
MDVTVFGHVFSLDERRIDAPEGAIRQQIKEYERGERRTFDLAVRAPDSFTGAVMKAMAAIPHGETRTYGDLAREVESSPVAVGQACGRNPIPLVIPCHRVVGRDSIGGFSADVDRPRALKRTLLDHERGATQSRLDTYR